MSVVISVRISRELREKMKEFRDVNWSEVVRRSIEEKIAQLEMERTINRVEEHLREIPELPRGTIYKWLRNDRESH